MNITAVALECRLELSHALSQPMEDKHAQNKATSRRPDLVMLLLAGLIGGCGVYVKLSIIVRQNNTQCCTYKIHPGMKLCPCRLAQCLVVELVLRPGL